VDPPAAAHSKVSGRKGASREQERLLCSLRKRGTYFLYCLPREHLFTESRYFRNWRQEKTFVLLGKEALYEPCRVCLGSLKGRRANVESLSVREKGKGDII